MTFINRYTKPDALNYYFSAEFTENGQNYILSAGQTKDTALISCINPTNGDVLWEKTYILSEVNGLAIHKLIQIPLNNQLAKALATQYIAYASDGKRHFVLSFNLTNGDIFWSKELFLYDEDLNFFIEAHPKGEGFYVVSSDKNQIHFRNYPWVLKFDAYGNFLSGVEIYGRERNFLANGFHVSDTELVLVGRDISPDSEAVIISLNHDLKVNHAFNTNNANHTFHDVKTYAHQSYILTGYDGKAGQTFVSVVYLNAETKDQSYPKTLIMGTSHHEIDVQAGDKGVFYLLTHNDTKGVFHQMDLKMNTLWSKTIYGSGLRTNGIRQFAYHPITRQLTFNSFHQKTESLLAYTNSALDSCLTQTVQSTQERSVFVLNPASFPVKERFIKTADIRLSIQGIYSKKIEYCPSSEGGTQIDTSKITALQSLNFYMQATGSTGQDSTKGMHLRWVFSGALGENHLPKGNYATTQHNFNKPEDFVKLYRTPYQKVQFELNFENAPQTVNDAQRYWIYKFNNNTRNFFVYFRNSAKYNQVRTSINPVANPLGFIQAYGNELIEVENKEELFFAVELNTGNATSSSSLQTELLSVSENTLLAPKAVSTRKTFGGSSVTTARLIAENGRTVRFKVTDAYVKNIQFEFYADFIAQANERQAWTYLDKYALTIEDSRALHLLEPQTNAVHGKWLRYNDGAYVNTANYESRWNAINPEDADDRNIKQVVEKYIALSNDASNPRANESIAFSEEPDEEDTLEISNLDMLNLAAYDYHIARMLGLGTLDLETTIMSGEFIYVAEYVTLGDLEDGLGKREVQHLSMSLPTQLSDYRLPLAIDIEEIKPGMFFGEDPSGLTDEEGYTHDGRQRYVSIMSKPLPEEQYNLPFYATNEQYEAQTYTFPVFGGLEYRKDPETQWQIPELPHDVRYLNVDSAGNPSYYETRFLNFPEEHQAFYVHQQRISGKHIYSSYGINWFSRATRSTFELFIETHLKPKNPLVPPTKVQALFIREENPLLLTSAEEQSRRVAITNGDKTLVRLTFDYHSHHELVPYKIPPDSAYTNAQIINEVNNPAVLFPDNEEIFAEEIDVFFRNQFPNQFSGKITHASLSQQPMSVILHKFEVQDFHLTSINETVEPLITSGTQNNYVGGSLLIGNQSYIIHEMTTVPDSMGNIRVTSISVYKKEISDGIVTDEIPTIDAENLQTPEITNDGYFSVIENMQTPSSWGTPNPFDFKVNLKGGLSWDIHREILEIPTEEGAIERNVEKSRGIWWDNTTVEAVPEPVSEIMDGNGTITGYNEEHLGMYKITFHGYQLDQHSQFNENGISVEWYRGIARLFTENSLVGNSPVKTRKVLQVVKIENIVYPGDSSSQDLVVYIYDPAFLTDASYDPIKTGNGISVNFYPSYKVYFYEKTPYGLYWDNIKPEEEDVKTSIFGLRVRDLDLGQEVSKISVPAPMHVQKIVEALPPEKPEGALYATRPDFFGRSTYTLTTKYQHKPHGVLFYRSNDEALLNALYKKETVKQIREALQNLGGNNEAYFTNRWQNFLNFTELQAEGDYKTYPPVDVSEDNYKFPNPDKVAFFEWANQIMEGFNNDPQYPGSNFVLFTESEFGTVPVGDSRLINFVKGAIYNAFVPLTKVPVIYQYINPSSYQPIDKKQIIKDKNGYALPPTHQDFDMAPMMRITGNADYETQFVDFHLDGTSNNIYFYGVKELSSQMKMGEFSPFLGPIKLVNTNAPEAPEVKRIMPVLENKVLGITPKIQLEINSYPEIQKIKKINIYRAFSKLDAQSIRTMQLAKTVDMYEVNTQTEGIWKVWDDFEDLDEVPYGDGLFYRVSVAREVEYADATGQVITEFAPSQASKIVATMMVEVANPPAPTLSYYSEPITNEGVLQEVTLSFEKTCYKGKYHLYQMNAQGNWKKIHELASNDAVIYLPLHETDLNEANLTVRDENDNPIYHHFKMMAENTSGMFSTVDKILTLYNENTWQDLGGISSDGNEGMQMGGTFIVRPD